MGEEGSGGVQGDGPRTERGEAFEGFYAAHGKAITSYVRRRAGDAEVGDIVAQVFCVAWRRFDAVPAPPEDRFWLYGVARRMVADHRRSVLRRVRLRQRLTAELPRPTDLDASKARQVLGWEPKVEFPHVLEEMVHNDIDFEKAKANLD